MKYSVFEIANKILYMNKKNKIDLDYKTLNHICYLVYCIFLVKDRYEIFDSKFKVKENLIYNPQLDKYIPKDGIITIKTKYYEVTKKEYYLIATINDYFNENRKYFYDLEYDYNYSPYRRAIVRQYKTISMNHVISYYKELLEDLI